jgi:hypothetical protein
VGTGIGYWMRGPAPALAPDVPITSPAVTKAPEQPIGTEVAVKPPPKPSPSLAPVDELTPRQVPAATPAARRPRVTPRPTPRAAAVAPKASNARGSVLVQTRPAGATVSIDGKSLGSTPVRIPELAPGSHAVRVSLKGYRTVTATVVVRAGEQTLLRLSLEVQ